MNFDQVIQKTKAFEEFDLKWRFLEEKHIVLPKEHLSKITPLNSEAHEIIGNFLFEESGFIGQYKLNEEHFESIIEINLRTESEFKTRKWFDDLNIDSEETLLLFWDSSDSAVTSWEILKMYYDSFYYPASDDLIITNRNANWVLYFFHEEVVYFGVKKSQ